MRPNMIGLNHGGLSSRSEYEDPVAMGSLGFFAMRDSLTLLAPAGTPSRVPTMGRWHP